MIACIMQPTYLPWSGYFNLIAQSKEFVFLDDVQFSHQSWQQRNRIVVNGQPYVLTVPVLASDCGPQLIRDVCVDDSKNWRKKHLRTIQQTYARHPFGREAACLVERTLQLGSNRLAEINMALIRGFCEALGLQPSFHLSSELRVPGARSERLLKICRLLGAQTYLSPRGSQDYLEEDGVFAGSEIALVYQEFVPAPYPQRGMAEFISHMSVVDLVANVGLEGGRMYVKPVAA
ncbi:MAG: WbqC family protein [Thermoguttaceae bacterium]